MKTEIAKVLLSSPEYLEFERYIQEEILKAERKAIESIHSVGFLHRDIKPVCIKIILPTFKTIDTRQNPYNIYYRI